MNIPLRLSLLGVLLAPGAALAAEQNGWAIGTGAVYSDNVLRTSTNEASETALAATGSINAAHDGARVDASIRAIGQYLYYLDNSFDNDLIGSAQASLQFAFVPDRFTWTFDDNFGQLTRNPFEPVTSLNRQNVNAFSTGPDLVARLGAATSLRLNGRWATTSYEQATSTDDSRWRAGLSLVRELSERTNVQLATNYQDVSYDAPGNPGYETLEYFLRFESASERQTLSADAGYTQIKENGNSGDTPLFRLTWDRQLSAFVRLNAAAGTEYRNASDQFIAGIPDAGGTGDVLTVRNSFQSTYGALGLNMDRPRTKLGLRFSYGKDDYKLAATQPTRDTWTAAASLTRKVSPKLDVVLSGSYIDRSADVAAGNDQTYDVSLRLDWQAGRTVYFSTGLRSTSRNSDVATYDYDETMAFLSVGIRTGSAPIANLGY